MAEGGGRGAEQESTQTSTGVTRRDFLRKAAVATGAGLVVATGAFKAAERAGVFQENQKSISATTQTEYTAQSEISGIFGGWSVLNKADIDGAKLDTKPALRPILSKEGQQLGQVLETTIEVNSGAQQASLDFVFKKDPKGDYRPLTSGWQSWSSSAVAGSMYDKLVGMQASYQKSLGGKTVTFYEPGSEQKIPETEGRSYGWVGFRDMRGGGSGENVVLGIIPGFDSLEGIRYRQEGGNIIVSVSKNLEGVSTQRAVTFKVFLGQGSPYEAGKVNYADLIIAYSKELSKLAEGVPLMKDRVIGFSWPVYSKQVTQTDVSQEIKAGKGIFDTYVIDDGWETRSGSLEIDLQKFPDLAGLATQMKDAGIKPGIWTSPFKISEEDAKKLPPDWLMKDEHGKPRRIPLTGVAGVFEKSLMLDISNSDVRKYLIDKMVNLAGMGFEVFKADFLAVPFTGQLQNKDKTSVEYYRQFFKDWRQAVRGQLVGKEIEIIGCGAPIEESIGLFNGFRYTPDSSILLETFIPVISKIKSVARPLGRFINEVSSTNTGLYKDAVAVAARRTLPLRGVHGLIFDGLHMADQAIPLDTDKRDRLNRSMQASHRLGINNLFVGDSFARTGSKGWQIWQNFISTFKMGNVELVSGKPDQRKLKKIPDRYATTESI